MWFVPPAGRGMGEQREEVEITKQKIFEVWVPCGAGVSESRGGTLWVWGHRPLRVSAGCLVLESWKERAKTGSGISEVAP